MYQCGLLLLDTAHFGEPRTLPQPPGIFSNRGFLALRVDFNRPIAQVPGPPRQPQLAAVPHGEGPVPDALHKPPHDITPGDALLFRCHGKFYCLVVAHPFQLIPAVVFRWALRISLSLAVLLFGILLWQGAPLRNEASPLGIVSLELAGTPERAARILESWQLRAAAPAGPGEQQAAIQQPSHSAAEAAFRSLLLGFPFLLSYALGLSLASLRAGGRLGVAFAWLIWLAALLDAVENTLLLRLMSEGAHSPLPEFAFVCAAAKFLLVIATLAHLGRKVASGNL